MGKKELKRDLKLYKSDLNSMADESIYYRERAEKAEAMVEKLVDCGNAIAGVRVHSIGFSGTAYVWYKLVDEWHASPPKPYRAEAAL